MQSDIFKFVIQSLKQNLSNASDFSFSIVDEISKDKSEKQIQFTVIDIFQTTNDKTGQRIIVDECRYEVPALYEMRIRVNIFAPQLEELLSLFGYVAVFFKDHTVYECAEYNWYGNEISKFILEPVIRKETINTFIDTFHLDYRVEVQLNSLKGEQFVRVEKKELNAKRFSR
ncbi:MAG: hypothetical protein ACI4DS_07555 [Eubacterium sp.]